MKAEELSRIDAAMGDRYRVERRLGEGGMAVVYLAEDLKHGRKVAIKVLKQQLALAIGRERFLREIKIEAQLEHRGILPLYDSGEIEGLLYFVMRYVEGQSLRDLLEREGALPIERAISIAHQVGDALAYAHSHGIIHRDVKPDNILLSDNQAVIADFGIARAFSEAGGDTVTQTGHAVGTPAYMSPEQASAEAKLDARSDIYSLACVVYEMLAGEPPFTGPSAQAVIARHMLEPPRSLSVIRPAVRKPIVTAIETALQKTPADRFQSVEDFIAAIESETTGPTGWRPKGQWKSWKAAARALVGAGAVTAVLVVVLSGIWDGAGSVPDDTQYVIFPFEYSAEAQQPLDEIQRLHDALTRWTGLTVADPYRVQESLAQRDSELLTHAAASNLARSLGAGRYLRGSVSRLDDSLRVRAAVYDAVTDGGLIFEAAVRLALDLSNLDRAFNELADHLLLGDLVPDGVTAYSGTRSLPARRAFAEGQASLRAWDLVAADSAFSKASRLDSGYAEAFMWLALVRSWSGVEEASWRISVEQASLGRGNLSAWKRTVTDALAERADGALEEACALWQEVTASSVREFTAWYGLADCLASDMAVIPDLQSPSGWRFRTSYHSALLAYERAFELQPSILNSLGDESFRWLRSLFMTAGNGRRHGRALLPDTTRFAATPAWQGDSVAFVPYPIETHSLELTVEPAARDEAVWQLQSWLKDVAVAWVSSSPESASAVEALAVALAMLGDAGALDTLRRARALARDRQDFLRIAGAEVWMQLAFSLPSHSGGIQRARALADSVLQERIPGGSDDPILLAGLAALTGRAMLAASYARTEPFASAEGAPPALRETAPPLLMFAAMGGPVDSLAVLEDRVNEAIEERIIPARRMQERLLWLGRPATLAFPVYRSKYFSTLVGQGDYLVDIQAAWANGDREAARQGLDTVREARQGSMPANLPFDALYPEADLLVTLGDLQGAVEWMDPTFRVLPHVTPFILADPVRAASLVRAMALRAQIADRMGDSEAAREWATAVVTLWSDCDPSFRPLIAELDRLR